MSESGLPVRRTRPLLWAALAFALGIIAGGYLWSRTQPRAFLALADCEARCMQPKELAGLLASVGVQRLSFALPLKQAESDFCIAVRHPRPEGKLHWVLFPKRDVRNVAELTPDDQPFVIGCYAMAGELIRAAGVGSYRMYTNGPGLQHVAYLHFHVVAR